MPGPSASTRPHRLRVSSLRGTSTGGGGSSSNDNNSSSANTDEESTRFSLLRLRGSGNSRQDNSASAVPTDITTDEQRRLDIERKSNGTNKNVEARASGISGTSGHEKRNSSKTATSPSDGPPALVDYGDPSSGDLSVQGEENVEAETSLRNILQGSAGESARSIVSDNASSRSILTSLHHQSAYEVSTPSPSTPGRSILTSSPNPLHADLVAAPVLRTPESAESHGVSFSNSSALFYYRRGSVGSAETGSTVSDMDEEDDVFSHGMANADVDFYPQVSRDHEWMGRSIESLILGHVHVAPILQLLDDEDLDDGNDWDFHAFRRRSTASTFGGGRRRSSAGSFPGGRRGSLSLSGGNAFHGGTMANYYSRRQRQIPTDVDRSYNERQGRRGSTSHTPMYRRRSSIAASGPNHGGGSTNSVDSDVNASGVGQKGGPNVVLSLMARESTGKSCFARGIPPTQCLRKMGGHALYLQLDKPAGGIATEVAFLAAAIDTGDWTETQTIITRLAPRLIGDPMSTSQERSSIEDPNLPPTAPKFYAGGGRIGLERDAFVQAGGVEVLIRVFREKSFVGQEMAYSYDARDLSPEIVAARLAPCWNEALASLRELVFSIPSLVEDRKISDNGEFLPFLFTLLSHDSCFDSAAALIEEILALLSQSPQPPPPLEGDATATEPDFQPVGRVNPPTTFFLGNVPDLYNLWAGFSCRQLAHFCRILALLVFEPEDRQLLESPAVLKSLELLQLRRNRAVRASRDSTVDVNQSILLGDENLLRRLLMLLRVMNFAPALRRFAPYHVMSQYPFVGEFVFMLGLKEIEDWSEIDRQEALARELLQSNGGESSSGGAAPLLSELGGVANMLEELSESLDDSSAQIGHFVLLISAAQRAGVVVGRNSRSNGGTASNPASAFDEESAIAALRMRGIPVDHATIQGLASVAGVFADQVMVRRLRRTDDGSDDFDASWADGDEGPSNGTRYLIKTPRDSANSLQFNAILLGPYQVEVLFVLCTLLGGRRKLDAQDMLERLGMVPVLDDMFQRLPWFRRSESSEEPSSNTNPAADDSQPNGIHGPGCECTPESALCVQYLRLLHNFCDRDCDNYFGRRLLLSEGERQLIAGGPTSGTREPGLLSKIITAFMGESDESPYRFWLASCIESYLRGSSPEEQTFVAHTGLMDHLIADVSSDRLHCAGSLQTSFDLLGELGKGNAGVIRMLVNDLDEESFRKLMSVAAANLVDSNVFLRSLLLSLERLSANNGLVPLYIDAGLAGIRHVRWRSSIGSASRSYLTHSWWDVKTISLSDSDSGSDGMEDDLLDENRSTDWFPSRSLHEGVSQGLDMSILPSGLEESVGHFGWVFTPGGDALSSGTYLPNTVERLSWFLAANQARLLRDLLGVVDLRNINHENICCLNTAVVIAIFAHRRQQLAVLLHELRQMNDEEKETKRRALNASQHHDDVVDRAFAQAMRYLDIENQREAPPYARSGSITHMSSSSLNADATTSGSGTVQHILGDRTDVMRNFREVLWFWTEYYTHRGRDRLSLEFSSHLRFQEWNHVVSLLTADDGSPTSLVRSPPRLPRSPYQRAARTVDNPVRGV